MPYANNRRTVAATLNVSCRKQLFATTAAGSVMLGRVFLMRTIPATKELDDVHAQAAAHLACHVAAHLAAARGPGDGELGEDVGQEVL